MPARPPIRGIIFDFDGVLADTEHLHLQAFQEAFSRRGWRLDEAAYFDSYLGYNDEDLVRVYARDHALDLDEEAREEVLGEKERVFLRHIEGGAVLYPGAAGTVRALAARFPLAIASGSRRDEIVRILTAGRLIDAFPVIVSSDDVVNSKPAPEVYLSAAARLGLDPITCVAIEDSHWGLDAARAAGLRTIAVTTTSPAAVLQAADRIVDRVEDVTLALLDDLARPEAS
jgi:beta-phosphoglucomutase